jgi:flagellar hook-associated protein 2
METALGTLQNQASWLTSQIAGLPSWSSSSK